jgi:hypothetical protein
MHHMIRGRYYVPGVIGVGHEYHPPDFCEDCGAPFPWLSRQGRIYHHENMLDKEDTTGRRDSQSRSSLRRW